MTSRDGRLLRALIPAPFIGFRTTEVAAVSSFRCSSRDYAAARTHIDGVGRREHKVKHEV